MKKKPSILKQFSFILITSLLAYSCSGIVKTTDIFVKPTAKEIYLRDFSKDSPQVALWEKRVELALQDSLTVTLPYAEVGRFSPESSPVHSYEVAVNPGEKLQIGVQTDSTDALVFLDVFKQKIDSLVSYEHLLSSDYRQSFLDKEIEEPGIYKIVVQPEIAANTPFQITIQTVPVYQFPVASKGNESIQSYWGAVRDGGRRSHEGIDIFAPRGTPVIATTAGRITRTGNRGLGGKQVWVRDSERGLSLYYAHLDSIIARPGMRVIPGDTLGLVGNTGNARTTPPHLHFGIYKGYSGAVNPLPYVYQTEGTVPMENSKESFQSNLLKTTAIANLRSGPSTRFPVSNQIKASDTLQLLGATADWYHVRSREKAAFIHRSLVTPL